MVFYIKIDNINLFEVETFSSQKNGDSYFFDLSSSICTIDIIKNIDLFDRDDLINMCDAIEWIRGQLYEQTSKCREITSDKIKINQFVIEYLNKNIMCYKNKYGLSLSED